MQTCLPVPAGDSQVLQPAGSSRAASVGSGCAGLSRQASAQPLQGGCLSPSPPATPQQQGEAGAAPGQQEDDALPAVAAAVGTPDAEAPAQHSALDPSASRAVPLVSPAAPTTPATAAAPAAGAQGRQQAQPPAHGSSKGALEAGSPPCSSPARSSAPRPVQPPLSPSPDPIAEQARLCSALTDCTCALTHACACSADHTAAVQHELSAVAAVTLWRAFCRHGGRPAAHCIPAFSGVATCLRLHRPQTPKSQHQCSGAGAAGGSRGGEGSSGAGERAAAPREHQPAGAAVVHRAAAARGCATLYILTRAGNSCTSPEGLLSPSI